MAQWAQKQDIKRRIAEMDADILGIKENIKTLNTQLRSKEDQRERMLRTLHDLERASHSGAVQSGTKAGQAQQGINYMDGHFDWMGGLKARMRSVFGIDDFRLCQRGWVLSSFASLIISDGGVYSCASEYVTRTWTVETLWS